MSRPQHSYVSHSRFLAVVAGLALAAYIIALPPPAPTPAIPLTGPTATATLTATKTPTRTATASPTVTPGCTPGVWNRGAPYARNVDGAATATDGTFAYTFGGNNGLGTVYAESDRYDPVSNSWSPLASIATGGDYLFHAEYGGNGKIYLMGGTVNGKLNRIYDIATDSWNIGAPLPASRYDHGHAAFNGKIYVIGGYNSGAVNTVYVYDIVSDMWSTLAPLPQCEYNLA